MLQVDNIELDIDNDNMEINHLLIRNVRGKNQNGDIDYKPELQFRAKNIAHNMYVGFEVAINYYDDNQVFLGFDHSHYFGLFNADDEASIALDIEVPSDMARTELVVELGRPYQTERLIAESNALDEKIQAELERTRSLLTPLPKNVFQALLLSPYVLWIVIVLLLIIKW
ncbi:MAG: hypothetical protein ACRBBR_12305 [Cellvibrionaceae bacterium]